ncbi:centrosomal protein POC5 [Chanos chanos]|uniref:Centrosomal protein POC5 n=1 Tax=Chanos chanos TaxID=29144 RepID=A0A6J2WU01_CHACN|nr:centrosomal protein POC5 [Chanos chanos]
MSSDEGEPSSPVLPRDSDRGSSVSSELQDEYEHLLRFAVVTPKYEPSVPSQLLSTSQLSHTQRTSTIVYERESQTPADTDRHSSDEVTSARVSPVPQETRAQSQTSEGDERSAGSDGESERQQTESGRSGHSTPDPLMTVVTELFISEENMNKMENILDTWSNKLKDNVMMELRKWKVAVLEQHRLELKKERQRHAAHVAGIKAELDSLRDLLHTYEISNQRKDEVIVNLSRAVDRQREKLELMRTFTQWRLQHSAAKEEAHNGKLAEQHYKLQLKRKVWAGWHSLIESRWRERVERACRARAEDVCLQLSEDYEAKIAQHAEALEKAQAEIQRLHTERERYEDSMKKAFMRGVCALNIEALTMFHTGERRPEHEAPHAQHEAGSSSVANLQPRPTSTARLSPVVMESPVHPPPSRSDAEEADMHRLGSTTTVPRSETVLSSTVVNTLPAGGSMSTFRQPHSTTRIVTASQQKATKTVTARITGRPDLSKAGRSTGSLNVMGVAPPMSSVIVERHHPVTQLTVGQATAAKFPRSTSQSQGVSSSKTSSSQTRGHSAFHLHSIKVVD